MSAVRLVREQVALADVVSSLVHLKETLREAMPRNADLSVCLDAHDEIRAEVLVPTLQDRNIAVFTLQAGLVPGFHFRSVQCGLEHATRGRHRVCAIVESA